MTLPTAAQFRQHLVSIIEFYKELGPVDPGRLQQGELRSEVMFKEDKKYHIDLKVRERKDVFDSYLFPASNLNLNFVPFPATDIYISCVLQDFRKGRKQRKMG